MHVTVPTINHIIKTSLKWEIGLVWQWAFAHLSSVDFYICLQVLFLMRSLVGWSFHASLRDPRSLPAIWECCIGCQSLSTWTPGPSPALHPKTPSSLLSWLLKEWVLIYKPKSLLWMWVDTIHVNKNFFSVTEYQLLVFIYY